MMMEEIQDLYTLSPLQQGMLFHSVYAKNSGMYMTQMAVTIKGRLEKAAFTRAWQRVVDRHSIFRTGFIWGETEQPLQVVYQQVPVHIHYQDWSQLDEEEQQNRLHREMEQERQTDFVLEEAPLMRWKLCKTGEERHEFIWTYHHVLLDGWSLPIVLQEVFSLYDAFCRGEQLSLPTPRPYHDYIKWLRAQDNEKDRVFWQQFLSGFTTPTPISIVQKTQVNQQESPSYQTVYHHCSVELTQSIQHLVKRQQLTLNTWVQGAWALLLSLYSGEKDIVYGTTVSGRPADLEGVEQMVGLFINTIPMRVRLDEQQTVVRWLKQIQQTAAELKQVEHTSLIDIQDWSELPAGTPLFNSLFVFENYPVQEGETTGKYQLQFANVRAVEQTNYPLTLVAAPGERLQLKVIFEQQRYEEKMIQRLLHQLEHLLQQLVERLDQPLQQLDLLPPEEQKQLQIWHEQPSKNTSWITIPDQIRNQAQQIPDQIAVMDGERTLTYQQLEEESNRIARFLRSLGIQKENRVAFCFSCRVEMVSMILGIWKAGAAYVPLDPNYPVERIKWMLEDAQVSVLMTEESLLPMFSDLSLPIFSLEEKKWESVSRQELPTHAQQNTLAYLIYTSGSTGKPKGVMIEHSNVCALVHWARQVYHAEELAGVLAATSICFDLSVFELFVPLTSGGSVLLVRDALSLKDFSLRNQVTLINTVPSAAAELVRQQAIPDSVQTINLAGEPLTRSLVDKLYAIPTVKRVYNLYGPSEDTTYSTFEQVERGTKEAPTIGQPIEGTQVYVLDQQGRRLPIGVIGELHLAGDGVARGYYCREALTAERFITHPQYGRLYCTGDLVHVDENGRLHFHGRRDFQVKVRGFRIELGEIEATLAQHPAVEETVVIVEEKEEDVRLLAYLVTTEEDDWRQYLKGKLPAYMIPNRFISLPEMPLTPNGKVDRQALPKIEQESKKASDQWTEQSPVAQIVLQICRDVLQQNDLTEDDHFFACGGHSLLATQVVSRLEQALELELPLRLIFEHPTIGELVHAVEEHQQHENERSLPPLQRFDQKGNVFPLSYAQQRLWFFEQMNPGQTTYHLPFAVRIKGECDLQKMQQAVNRMVQKHEILRTTFHEQDGEAVQQIHPNMEILVQEIFLTGDDQEHLLAQAIQQELQKPFSLSEGPLMRVFLYRLREKETVLLVHMHHIISDGWSMAVWLKEWLADEQTNELPVQYRDYVQWQREWLQDETYDEQLAYWKQQLADVPILELPTDRTRPSEQTFTGDTHTVFLPVELSQQLRHLSQEEDTTLFMTLLAGYQLLLSRYSGQNDIAVGSPIANRHQEELEPLIGFFVNTLTLRTQLDEKMSFRELLAHVRKTCLDAYAHQDIPFERVVDELQPERNLRYTPLFQAMFVLQNLPLTVGKTTEMQLEPYELKHQVAKFDLTLTMMEDGERLVSNWEYNVDLFSRQTIERMAQHFIQLLNALMADPDKAIGQIVFLNEEEENQLLAWRGERKRKTYPSLIKVFADQVKRNPTKTALQQGEKRLSYQQLDQRSTQLAHLLQKKGVQRGEIVGIYLPRSFDLIVSMIAILKVGAAYLPLDVNDPPKRSAAILRDAQARLVISSKQRTTHLPDEVPYCLLDQVDWCMDYTSLPIDSSADDLAYVMYTSGSTGKPKGVEIEQRGILRLVLDGDYAHFGAEEVFLQMAPTAFDASTFEIWGSLLHGSTLVLMPPETPSLAEIAKAIEQYSITTMWLTAGLFHLMVDHQLASLGRLKQLLVGGDVISPTHVKKVLALQSVRVINGYGPTENTTFTCCYPIPADWSADAPVPIGRPIAQTQVYVLDEQKQLVPCGVAGELYIGGDGLARGYLQQPTLTAKRFIDHPRWGRLYRTGDRVRFLPDGNLDFLGRMDQQVKIRGFRIELTEIEEVLRQHPQVHETVVIVKEKRLLAYLVYDRGQAIADAELRSYLREHLPEYMIPAAFLSIEAIPLTRNGKVDRSALPEPDFAQLAFSSTYVEPRNWQEEQLQKIWQEVLKVENIGIYDNFFQLGGDSILSIQVVAKAKQQGLQLTPKQIFSHQTIAELATVCQQSRSVATVEEDVQGEVPLTPIQHWFFEQQLADPHHFNQAILLQVDRIVSYRQIKQALQQLMKNHDVFRLRFEKKETWQQMYSEPEERHPIEWLDLSELSVDRQRETMQRIAERTQTQLDLQQGPLFRAVYFYLGDHAKAHRLLMVAHHLVVDGVSWRILLDDLEQLLQGKELPSKTTSYQKWAQQLLVEAQSTAVAQEREYWKQVVQQPVRRLPVDYPQGANTEELAETWVTQLSIEETEQLLRKAPTTYRAQMIELLLAAFGRTMVTWLDDQRCLFHMEGHGRAELTTGIDLSRTVGWFTSLYPVVLSFPDEADPVNDVRLTKQQWRKIPRQGLGYGLLQYLSDQPFTDVSPVEVSFNYLGQFGSEEGMDRLVQPVQEPIGSTVSPRAIRPYLLEVTAVISKGQLGITWRYSRNMYQEKTIRHLAEQFLERLRALLMTDPEIDALPYHADDFPLATVEPELLLSTVTDPEQVEDLYPVTPLQHGMLFHTVHQQSRQDYVTQIALKIRGQLNRDRFQFAWQQLVERHAILRTGFLFPSEGEPHQVVYRQANVRVKWTDWRGLPNKQRERMWQTLLKREREKGFALNQPPLMRLQLIRVTDETYRFVWTHHHVLLDGWSIPILLQELFMLYQGQDCAETTPFSAYVDWLQQQDRQAALVFWKQTLDGFTQTTQIPDTQNAPQEKSTPQEVQVILSSQLSLQLDAFAKQHRLTLNTVLQGAWAVLLSYLSGQRDLLYGVTSSGRTAELKGIEHMVGLLINTLPARVQVSTDEPLIPWLQSLQQSQVKRQQYAYLPLVEVQECSSIPMGTPLFETLFVFENYPVDSLGEREANGEFSIEDVSTFDQSHFPFTLIAGAGDRVSLKIAFDGARYSTETIKRYLQYYQHLLSDMVTHPKARLGDLSMVSEEEEKRYLKLGQGKKTAYPREKTLADVFRSQVERDPQAIALVEQKKKWTYLQVEQESNRFARYLITQGVKKGQRIAIAMDRSAEWVIGILAIIKTGAAYVPLDPAYPRETWQQMVNEAQPALLITDHKYKQRFVGLKLRKLILDNEKKAIEQMAAAAPAVQYDRDALAYVMYTSGSTGRPKGVAIGHRSILRLVKETDYARLSPEETFLLLAPVSFDASTFELWGSLLNGGRLVILREEKPTLTQIATTIVEQNVTTLWLTAGLFSLMVDYHLQALSGLRQLLVGGDVVSVPHVQKVQAALPHVQLINGYGPTESTTFACCFSVPVGWQGRSLPIGRPIAQTEVYVLDDQGKPLPPEVVGECYIGGDGLAHGYWQREDLTQKAFVPHPFSDDPTARLYRTGDLVRYTSDGEWIFVGRRDQQVKVRGYRVELSAIQDVLQKYEGVKESIIHYEREQKRLLAYVVGDVKSQEIQRYLARKLPPYMVPSQVIVLKELPLTTNGKIDRQALPRPQKSEQSQLPGRTSIEKRLISIWETILQRSPIGVHDHFFHLGGHSFHALQMMATIEKEWNIQLPLTTLFTYPTIAQLAERLQQEQEIQSSSLVVCLKQGQRETIPPLFLIHPQGGGVLSFAKLASLLEGEQAIYALQSLGYEGDEMPLSTIEAMAEIYLREIRKIQPQGPYYLLGWSMGGCIAHELACRIEAQGEQVAWVAMLDSTWLSEEMREPFIRKITAPETIEAQAKALQVESDAPQVVVWVNNGLAYAQYRPSQSLSTDLYLFRAKDEQQPIGSYRWKPFTKGKYHEIWVPGNHQSLLQEPHVQKLATHIRRLLPKPMKI